MRAGRILAVAAVVEAATGLALMSVPALVVRLLLGVELPVGLVPLGRVAGIAVLALGLACWSPSQHATGSKPTPAYRAMLIYNALVALYFVYIGVAVRPVGLLLWPAAAWHILVSLLLARSPPDEGQAAA